MLFVYTWVLDIVSSGHMERELGFTSVQSHCYTKTIIGLRQNIYDMNFISPASHTNTHCYTKL